MNTPGKDKNGKNVIMKGVNVHSGQKKNAAGKDNRGSAGCITISPSDSGDFIGNFKWNGGTKGSSSGTIQIFRGNKKARKLKVATIRRNTMLIRYSDIVQKMMK